jgi:hypothetical protein
MLRLKDNKIFQILLITLITFVIYIYYFQTQSPLTYSFSNLFDGVQYFKSYRFFKGESAGYTVSFPYHSRIMVPFLASLMPYDAINSFNFWNFIFILAGILMMYICWDRLGFPFHLILAGILWLLLHWPGIIRYNLFDPVTVDVPLYLFQALFLLAVIKSKPWVMLIVAVLSVLNKESVIPLVMIISIYYFYLWIRQKNSPENLIFSAIALFAVVFIKILLNHFFPFPEHGRGSLITLLFHVKETLLNPFRIIHWLSGFSVAFGPWLALYILTKIKNKSFGQEELIPALLSMAILVISFLGGGDFTRLIFLGFPFVMTLVFYAVRDINPKLISISLLMGLPLTRFWESIPDPALKGWPAFYNWHPEFAVPAITWLWIIYFLMTVLVLFLVQRRLQTK